MPIPTVYAFATSGGQVQMVPSTKRAPLASVPERHLEGMKASCVFLRSGGAIEPLKSGAIFFSVSAHGDQHTLTDSRRLELSTTELLPPKVHTLGTC